MARICHAIKVGTRSRVSPSSAGVPWREIRFRRADVVCELYSMTASSARFLNILGLAISVLTAFLMLSFPVYATPVMRDEKTGKWFESERFEWNTKQVPLWKVWRARL